MPSVARFYPDLAWFTIDESVSRCDCPSSRSTTYFGAEPAFIFPLESVRVMHAAYWPQLDHRNCLGQTDEKSRGLEAASVAFIRKLPKSDRTFRPRRTHCPVRERDLHFGSKQSWPKVHDGHKALLHGLFWMPGTQHPYWVTGFFLSSWQDLAGVTG